MVISGHQWSSVAISSAPEQRWHSVAIRRTHRVLLVTSWALIASSWALIASSWALVASSWALRESTRSRTFASNGTTTRSEIAPEIAPEVAPEALNPAGGLGGGGGSAGGAGGAAVGFGGALMTGAVCFVTSLSACNGKVRSCFTV